jgi:hypothetical protein
MAKFKTGDLVTTNEFHYIDTIWYWDDFISSHIGYFSKRDHNLFEVIETYPNGYMRLFVVTLNKYTVGYAPHFKCVGM